MPLPVTGVSSVVAPSPKMFILPPTTPLPTAPVTKNPGASFKKVGVIIPPTFSALSCDRTTVPPNTLADA